MAGQVEAHNRLQRTALRAAAEPERWVRSRTTNDGTVDRIDGNAIEAGRGEL